VSKELTVALRPAAGAALAQAWVRRAGIVLAGSAFVAVCAHISLPLNFTPVPLTLQPFAVLLLGLLMAPRLAAAALGAYLAEGALGLPVFTPAGIGAGGVAHLLGTTGGYLLSYPIAAFAISVLYRRMRRSVGAAMLSAAAGDVLILAGGALWFGAFSHASIPFVLTQTVVPFLPGDALKIAAAAGLAAGAARLRRNR